MTDPGAGRRVILSLLNNRSPTLENGRRGCPRRNARSASEGAVLKETAAISIRPSAAAVLNALARAGSDKEKDAFSTRTPGMSVPFSSSSTQDLGRDEYGTYDRPAYSSATWARAISISLGGESFNPRQPWDRISKENPKIDKTSNARSVPRGLKVVRRRQIIRQSTESFCGEKGDMVA